MIHSIIVELRPRLQVCNVFIVTKENLYKKECIRIAIKSSSITIEFLTKEKEEIRKFTLPDSKLIPHSLSGLQVQGSFITFRMQMEPLTNTSGSFSAEIVSFNQEQELVKPLMSKSFPNIFVQTPFQLSCQCCENKFSKSDITIERFLPLPSSSWENADLFCHQHSEADTPATTMGVKKSDCLYGTCYCLLNTSWLTESKGQIIRCKRCLSWLGTIKDSTAKLWHCTTTFGGIVLNNALEDFFHTIEEMVQDTFGMMCRLILESQVSEKETHYILLWIMDKELQLLVDIGNCGVKNVSQSTECNGLVEQVLTSKKTIKVLYMHSTHCDNTVKSWQQDMNVQSIDIAKQMFVEGLKYLMEITTYIPAPNRVTNNFLVAYLGL